MNIELRRHSLPGKGGGFEGRPPKPPRCTEWRSLGLRLGFQASRLGVVRLPIVSIEVPRLGSCRILKSNPKRNYNGNCRFVHLLRASGLGLGGVRARGVKALEWHSGTRSQWTRVRFAHLSTTPVQTSPRRRFVEGFLLS